MFIDDVTNAGAIPALELSMRFAGARHGLLTHNIANMDTPNFQTRDVSPEGFQAVLGEAIDRRRETGVDWGELKWEESQEVRKGEDGQELRLRPTTTSGNILFHDRNNRDLERLMQDLAENTAFFRVSSDLLRQQVAHIRGAIAERV